MELVEVGIYLITVSFGKLKNFSGFSLASTE